MITAPPIDGSSYLSAWASNSGSVLVTGEAGSGKTSRFVGPAIAQMVGRHVVLATARAEIEDLLAPRRALGPVITWDPPKVNIPTILEALRNEHPTTIGLPFACIPGAKDGGVCDMLSIMLASQTRTALPLAVLVDEAPILMRADGSVAAAIGSAAYHAKRRGIFLAVVAQAVAAFPRWSVEELPFIPLSSDPNTVGTAWHRVFERMEAEPPEDPYLATLHQLSRTGMSDQAWAGLFDQHWHMGANRAGHGKACLVEVADRLPGQPHFKSKRVSV